VQDRSGLNAVDPGTRYVPGAKNSVALIYCVSDIGIASPRSFAGATSYNLMVPGSGLVQYTGPLTSINKEGSNYCAPSHVVRACNASGCSAYSSPPYTQAFEDLGNPTALAAPSTGLQAPAQGEGE